MRDETVCAKQKNIGETIMRKKIVLFFVCIISLLIGFVAGLAFERKETEKILNSHLAVSAAIDIEAYSRFYLLIEDGKASRASEVMQDMIDTRLSIIAGSLGKSEKVPERVRSTLLLAKQVKERNNQSTSAIDEILER